MPTVRRSRRKSAVRRVRGGGWQTVSIRRTDGTDGCLCLAKSNEEGGLVVETQMSFAVNDRVDVECYVPAPEGGRMRELVHRPASIAWVKELKTMPSSMKANQYEVGLCFQSSVSASSEKVDAVPQSLASLESIP